MENRVGSLETLLLSKTDIESLLSIEEILLTVEDVYKSHGLGNVVSPPKTTLNLERAGANGFMINAAAYAADFNAAGIKIAGAFPFNPTREGLPQTMAIIILMNPKTGFPLAVMDGQFITVMRTGAAAAVAAKYLSPRVQVLSILGSGAVGKAAVRSFNKAFLLREIRIYDISENIARNTASMFQEQYGISLTVSRNAAICIDEADVVVTATDADNPLFPIENLKRDALVISLGSFRESPPKLVKNASSRIVDHLEQNKQRGEFSIYFQQGILNDADIYAEIGDIIGGKISPPPEGGWCVTSLIGVSSLDIVLAKKAYDAAKGALIRSSFRF